MFEPSKPPHPIVWLNRQNQRHWFNADGNYVDMFDGIDGKLYAAIVSPKDWRPEIWELYRKEGIRVSKPTPVENIHYPEEASD